MELGDLTQNKTAVIIFGVTAVAGLAYAFKEPIKKVFTKKPTDNKDADIDGKVDDPIINSGGTSGGTSGGATSGNVFPLRKVLGYKSQNKELQIALNDNYGQNLTKDGLFGGGTETALETLFGITQVSESDFNAIKAGTMNTIASGDINSGTNSPSNTSGYSNSSNYYAKLKAYGVESQDAAIKELAGKIDYDVTGLSFRHDDSVYEKVLALSIEKLKELNQHYKYTYNELIKNSIQQEMLSTATMGKVVTKIDANKAALGLNF